MAVTLTGSGGLFTRLGKLFGLAKTIRNHQIAIAPTSRTATTGVRAVFSAYASTTGTIPMATEQIGSLANEDLVAMPSLATLEQIRSAANRTLIETVDADTPLPSRTVNDALRELASQMVAASESVVRSTFTVGTPSYASSNIGNAIVVVSCEATKLIKDRVTFSSKLTDFPCIRAETISFTCQTDTRTGATRSGSETWHVEGERAYPHLDRRFRAGSGAAFAVNATSASVDGTPGAGPSDNVLTNSDFNVFASNVPVQWTLTAGTAGTHVTSSSTAFRGTAALAIVGDGSNLTKLRQRLAHPDGTLGRIRTDTLYHMSLWVRHDGTAPAAGVLRASLQDAAGNTLGSAMFVTVTLSGISSTYARHSVSVVSPIDVPDEAYAVIELTTALTNGRTIYVDEFTVSEMRRFAPGGPAVTVLPGSTDSRRGDKATVAITAADAGEFNLELDRFFGLYESGIALPSAASTSATVSDTLIA